MSSTPVKDELVDVTGSAEVPTTITPTQKLRDKLSAFRFREDSSPALRRSPRGHIRGRFAKFEEVDTELPTLPSAAPSPQKRSRTEEVLVKLEETAAPLKRARTSRSASPKKKREVAPPEKYAHLDPLTDHLGDGADMLDGGFGFSCESVVFIIDYSYCSDVLWHQVSSTCRIDTSVPLTADTVVLVKCLQPSDTTLLTPLTTSGAVYMALVGSYKNLVMTASRRFLLSRLHGSSVGCQRRWYTPNAFQPGHSTSAHASLVHLY